MGYQQIHKTSYNTEAREEWEGKHNDINVAGQPVRVPNFSERAPTAHEFHPLNRGTVVCLNCRVVGSHRWQQCQNAAFCSICQTENHRDALHNSLMNNQTKLKRVQWDGEGMGPAHETQNLNEQWTPQSEPQHYSLVVS